MDISVLAENSIHVCHSYFWGDIQFKADTHSEIQKLTEEIKSRNVVQGVQDQNLQKKKRSISDP